MARNPTMIDVATEAGVALKTVSRYVNGADNINDAMAARIAAAITKLGYRRNLAAASIRPGWTSKTVGLLISDLANPYYSSIARGAESVLTEAGYLLITASSEEDGATHDRLVDSLFERQVDAIIVVPPRSPGRSWSSVREPHPPVVFIDRPAALDGADTIVADNRGGAREAVELLRSTHGDVAFLGDSLSIYTMQERYLGYVDALRARGEQPDPTLANTGAHSEEQAYAAAIALLQTGRAGAIFAANNRATIGALRAFAHEDVRLPLIGFDDFEAATLVRPAVSVVSQDPQAMGRLAAEVVLQRLAREATTPARFEVLPTSLVLRGSELD
ncbi:LacI family transcriptional regulator [Microbacterium sp. SSW1-49]|uniref:LacI family transcriptional regulator n=1 Tax=Microbacterium croceum TaxID=2851645 RepID=A0ABT0FA61_9MICO|nr:LacI family DNA-binding transcriptional regulator [Microbacterium croceum]MCK2034931.1 LacI family transcriptional regulator [Microbacterium croceum]